MLFDFAAVDTPLSDSLVLEYDPGPKRIGWAPPALGLDPTSRRRGSGTPPPKGRQ
ncbi:MAG TPA: hypothetical protein VGR19_05495 [Allosphingosinicella sp.]|nr:hypothetical protein [Allosphingosinicella sp.]